MENFTLVNKTITIVAKRDSGKSYLLKWLVTQYKEDFNKIFVICPTENVNKFYQKNEFIKGNCIYDSYDESFVNSLITKMTKCNEGKDKKSADFKQVLLILDDLVADTNFHNSPSLKKLYARGRHVGIAVIITSQYLYAIPPIARANSDYVVVGQLNKQGLDILCEEFITAGLTKEEFINIYKNSSRDYSFMVVNNNSTKTDDINESYGKIKTPDEFIKKN